MNLKVYVISGREVGPGVPGALDAAEEGEKKMSLGKKMMLGAGGLVALLGATFLMSTPTPPPPPEKSTSAGKGA